MKNINKTTDEYSNLIKKNQPPVKKVRNIIRAFVVGGLISVLGQGLWNLYLLYFDLSQDDAGALATITLIFLGGLLTGLGVYDNLGQFAGAGSIVPVTGFANAMVSPAMEYKQEGYILGIGAKLFSVAGPVLTYGMVSAFIIGALKQILGG
ncbi:MAG TPA: stage V sporulation protein AC [Halanaerobiales bacterium]|nr:stage V sporulation protein AC [Halanaerobiales bacterium]